MKRFKDQSVQMKLSLGFGGAASIFALAVLFTWVGLFISTRATARIADHVMPLNQAIFRLQLGVSRTKANLLTALSGADLFKREQVLNEIGETDLLPILREILDKAEEETQREVLKKVESTLKELQDTNRSEVLPLIREDKLEDANRVVTVTQDARTTEIEDLLKSLLEAQLERSKSNTASVQASNRVNLVLAALLLFAASGFSVFMVRLITRSIARPLVDIMRVCREMALGNLAFDDCGIDTQDEMGQMADSLRKVVGKMRRSMATIGGYAQSLVGSSRELSGMSQQMAHHARETTEQVNLVASSADEVNHSIHSAASSAEEMGASVVQVASNASEAARVAQAGVTHIQATDASVAKLGESISEIGNVVKIITTIAEQTNLLALNASIEAAHAREAGKGFAVVAGEVKKLADATVEAIKDIQEKVEAIQRDAQESALAIGGITSIITQINDLQDLIAASTGEQSQAAGEIGVSTSHSAAGSSRIAEGIAGVAAAARGTADCASGLQTASAELGRIASELESLVSEFTY